MSKRSWSFVLGALAFAFAPSVAVQAQDNTVGAGAFAISCAVCHGSTGQGDGEFADVLAVKPANLTQLAANNNGVFPFLKVFQTVDGRAMIPAHGTRIMPIWGDSFSRAIGEGAGPFGQELLIRAKIVALVEYVEALQK
jgi:mono/diheme cytochrome c family protein